MGEENKPEEKKEEEKKEEEKKVEEPPEIVLKVDMHCESCARKVARALKGFKAVRRVTVVIDGVYENWVGLDTPGVEDVTTDSEASMVVKGKAADPIKVCKRLQKKSGKKVELISPSPKPVEEEKKEEPKEPENKEEKKEEPPAVVTVILKVRMHCEACAQVLQKRIRKIQGVESVVTDVGNDQVVVTGVVDPAKLADDVYKKIRKHVSIVPNEEEKKEEEKKEEDKKEGTKDGGGEKKEGETEEGKGSDVWNVGLVDLFCDLFMKEVDNDEGSPTLPKRKRNGGAAHLAKQIDHLAKQIYRICEVIESRSTSTSMINTGVQEGGGTSIKEVMKDVTSLPGAEHGSGLWFFATRLFLSSEKREMYCTMDEPNLKLEWLKYEMNEK